MAKKRPYITPEDLKHFHEAVKGTIPLATDKIHLSAYLPRKKKAPKPYDQTESLNLTESLSLDPVQGEEFISFKQAGISNKILSHLRKGQYTIEATLDLHGLFVEKAKIVIDEFLQQCLHDRIRVVLIIHGKGHHSEMPILKNKLNHWLRELPAVLAFCSASRAHGSRGAIYVLLKRNERRDTLE